MPAKAQDFDNVIAFGDSLSDTGNLFALTGSLVGVIPGVEATPASPPYFDGRFSNGPVWVELLSQQITGNAMNNLYLSAFPPGFPPTLNAATGNVNAAIGGARSDNNPSVSPLSFGIPQQIVDFQTAGGAVGANDLVTLWGGANNLFQDATPATAVTAAQDAAAAQIVNLNTVIDVLNAKTILLPNLPPLPGFSIVSNPSSVFNQVLDVGTEAAAAANPDVNIVQMDVFSAFLIIASNPQAFGFTDVTTPCLNTATLTVCSNPNERLFWDDVHPTAPAHALLALYAGLLLTTDQNALAVAPLLESSLYTRLDASQTAFNRTLDALSFPEQWHPGLYAEVIGSKLNIGGSGGKPGYDEELGGVRGGLNGSVGPVIGGISLAYLRGDHGQSGLSANVETVQGDIHAAMRFQSFFVSGEAGFSYTSFENITRFTGFPTVNAKADADGMAYSGSIGTGLIVDMGGFKLIPNGRVGYLNADLDQFSESAPILALDYAERSISSGFWALGLRGTASFGSGAAAVTAYAEAGYESLFSTDTDDITARLVENTALPVTVGVDDPASRGFYLKLGAGGQLNRDTVLSFDYGLSLPEDDGETHTGRVQLKFLLGGSANELN
ncbi:MAG: autotransporter domain-containing protein [Rhodomicrobium sp.]|nr:autotransporter domain-containing protein [Rhodomicrobium sp.]